MLKLPPLPTIKEIIKLYDLKARQELSQNFILDLNLATRIAKVAGDLRNSTVIEVGPGPGSLTRSLLNLGAKKVIAVEKDARFLPVLDILREASDGRLEIIHADMLELNERDLVKDVVGEDWESEKEPVKIVGNLPFNVATEMLLKWLRQIPNREGTFCKGRTSLTLLFQKEVAQRITALPGSKEYGRLSVMSQQRCRPELRFDVVGKAFTPPPDVTAAVIKIKPLIKPVSEVEAEPLEYVLRQVFGMRRKHLSNAIKSLCEPKFVDQKKKIIEDDDDDEDNNQPIIPTKEEQQNQVKKLIELSDLRPDIQPDQLTVSQWCGLAGQYRDWLTTIPPESPAAVAYQQFLDNLQKKRNKYDSEFFTN